MTLRNNKKRMISQKEQNFHSKILKMNLAIWLIINAFKVDAVLYIKPCFSSTVNILFNWRGIQKGYTSRLSIGRTGTL